MDMDFSPDFGGLGDRNPPSDHPTPSTLNSSSNTSYSISGMDNPSPGKKHQKSAPTQETQSGTSFDKIHSVHISPTSTESPAIPDMSSFSGQMYSNRSNNPAGDAGATRTYSQTPGWELPASNSNMSHVDLGSLNVDSLSETQWAQILDDEGSGAGWDNWRPS